MTLRELIDELLKYHGAITALNFTKQYAPSEAHQKYNELRADLEVRLELFESGQSCFCKCPSCSGCIHG